MIKITSSIDLGKVLPLQVPGGYTMTHFYQSGEHFHDTGWTLIPDNPKWITVKQSYYSSPDYVSGHGIFIKNMVFKKSIGSEPYSENVSSRMRNAVVTSGAVPYKKPKKPVFHELKFYGKEPVYRPFNPDSLKPLTRPQKMSVERWNSLLPLFQYRRDVLVSKINSFRLTSFEVRMKKFVSRKKDFARRQEEHKLIHLKRMAKYEVRLAIWQACVDRAAKRTLRLLPRGKYSEYHPYLYFVLRSVDDSPSIVTDLWNSDPENSLQWRAWVCRASPHASGVAFADPSLLEATLEDFGNRLVSALSPHLEDSEGKLVRKLYDKISNQKIHFGNIIAERAQTFSMLVTNFNRLYALFTLKKGILKGIGDFIASPRKWADEVLAFKFGAEPLMNDIMQGYEILTNDTQSLDVHAVTRTKFFKDIVAPGISFSGYVEISYSVKLTCENDFAKLLSSFGLLDPSQIAWEVTPWSFVVDWFIPIGAWISAQTATVGLNLDSCLKSFKFVGTFDLGLETPPDPEFLRSLGDSTTVFKSFAGKFEGHLKCRRFVSLPPTDRMLQVKSPWSWSHGVEAVALAVQRMRKL